MVAQAGRLLVGQQVQPGLLAILSLVETQGGWIEANFKETDVGKMVPGMPATVDLDAYPGKSLTGVVISIGAGTGSEFSLLPPQNATGNWVKVVQRVPVEVTSPSRWTGCRSARRHRARPSTSTRKPPGGLVGTTTLTEAPATVAPAAAPPAPVAAISGAPISTASAAATLPAAH